MGQTIGRRMPKGGGLGERRGGVHQRWKLEKKIGGGGTGGPSSQGLDRKKNEKTACPDSVAGKGKCSEKKKRTGESRNGRNVSRCRKPKGTTRGKVFVPLKRSGISLRKKQKEKRDRRPKVIGRDFIEKTGRDGR